MELSDKVKQLIIEFAELLARETNPGSAEYWKRRLLEVIELGME